jgi:hypothetical protein
LADIFIIVSGKNKIFSLPTYLPIGHIADSERGSKEYFKLGLIWMESEKYSTECGGGG